MLWTGIREGNRCFKCRSKCFCSFCFLASTFSKFLVDCCNGLSLQFGSTYTFRERQVLSRSMCAEWCLFQQMAFSIRLPRVYDREYVCVCLYIQIGSPSVTGHYWNMLLFHCLFDNCYCFYGLTTFITIYIFIIHHIIVLVIYIMVLCNWYSDQIPLLILYVH